MILGAILAFSLLNAAAVAVGGFVGVGVPAPIVRSLAALMFAGFGLHALLSSPGEEEADDDEGPRRHPVLATAVLLLLAELGDKTQLSVTALASVQSPIGTWLGATAALTATSALAALAGAWLLPRLPRPLIARGSGVLFLLVAAWLVWGVLSG